MTQHREAWIQQFVRDRGHFIGFLRVLCRDSQWAEDLFQELSVAVLEHIDRFDPTRDFGAWVRGLARNIYRKALRTESHRLKRLAVYDPQTVDAVLAAYDGRAPEEGVQLEALRQCLEQVPEPHRSMLRSRYALNLPIAQVAEVSMTDISPTQAPTPTSMQSPLPG